MVLVDEDQLFQLLREAKENGQIELLNRVLNVVNDLIGEHQEASHHQPTNSDNEDSQGKETDVASKEEIGGPRATRCFMQLDNVPGGPCGHCGTRTSSAWRKGPVGKDELCNQCGARYIQKGTLHGFFPIQRGGAKAGPPSGDLSAEKATKKPDAKGGVAGSDVSPQSTGSLTIDLAAGTKAKEQNMEDAQKPHRPKAVKGGVGESSLKIGAGDSPGVKKLATAKGSRPIDTNSGSGPTDAANPQDSEWMKILEQLENKPSLGGSIRELRELLIQAIYAAKEEGWACAMQIPERLQGTLDMVTNRSVIQARRMALNLLEEARINTAECSQCGAQRLTRHKIVDPKSFRCGMKECLYPRRECGDAPDAPSEWYFESDLEGKRGQDIGGKGQEAPGAARGGNGAPQRPGAMAMSAPMYGPGHAAHPSGWHSAQSDMDAHMQRMSAGGKRRAEEGREGVESLEAAFATDAPSGAEPPSGWYNGRERYMGRDDNDMHQGPDGKRMRPLSPHAGGTPKPDRMKASALLAISGTNGRSGAPGPYPNGPQADGGYSRPDESDEMMVSEQWRHSQAQGGRRSPRPRPGGPPMGGPAYPPPYPEGAPMPHGGMRPGMPPGAYDSRHPYGPPGAYGYGAYSQGSLQHPWPGMMQQQGYMDNHPDYQRGRPGPYHDSRGGYDRGAPPGGEGSGAPPPGASRGGARGGPEAGGPHGMESGMPRSPPQRPGSPSDGPMVLWRAEVQPPESKDTRGKVLLFKVKSLVPAWLFPKLPPVLVVKGFTPRNNIDISSVSTKPLMMELDELVDQQRLDLNMMIVDRVAIMCELPEFHLALVPHRNQYASLHVLGMVLPKNADTP